MRVFCVGCLPMGRAHSPLPAGLPRVMARYVLCTSRAAKASARRRRARSESAVMTSPEVSLSSLWTIPGRCPSCRESCGKRMISLLTRVPFGQLGQGCMVSPSGLLMTAMSWSLYRMSSGPSSAAGDPWGTGSESSATCPGRRRASALAHGLPSTRQCPSSTNFFTRLRDSPETEARKASSLTFPPVGTAARTVRSPPSISTASIPSSKISLMPYLAQMAGCPPSARTCYGMKRLRARSAACKAHPGGICGILFWTAAEGKLMIRRQI